MLSLEEWKKRAEAAESEAHKILAAHEASRSRVIHLNSLLNHLSGVPIDIQEYFKESIRCLETGCIRAGMVMAWCGFFEIFAVSLFDARENEIRLKRAAWKFKDLAELKEGVAEGQLLDAAKEVGYIGKARLRILQGHLATRNQCAHPTLYVPSLNAGIGYIDELLCFSREYLTVSTK
ncbi:hypothetical protein [Pseudomonas sp. Marseille-Q0931]|uniref:hypothetical protein n=1 Tax=Pseudomonas sp. Marseille-Q0931 TaxID=2697507 RepID=UPI0023B90F6E|nr:hypothetical protein [Pseudomonas sp. Marseille-Q0931]